jgi:hypothetical protein
MKAKIKKDSVHFTASQTSAAEVAVIRSQAMWAQTAVWVIVGLAAAVVAAASISLR